jgi:hypothetical protein
MRVWLYRRYKEGQRKRWNVGDGDGRVRTREPRRFGEARTEDEASSATRARWMAIRESGCTPCPSARPAQHAAVRARASRRRRRGAAMLLRLL